MANNDVNDGYFDCQTVKMQIQLQNHSVAKSFLRGLLSAIRLVA